MNRNIVEIAADLCNETTIDGVHKWVSMFNMKLGHNVNAVEVVLEKNKRGANIKTAHDLNSHKIHVKCNYCSGNDGDLYLALQVNMPMPSDMEPADVDNLMADIARVCTTASEITGDAETRRRRWTDNEDKILREYMEGDSLLTVRDIASMLDRTEASITTRMSHFRTGKIL